MCGSCSRGGRLGNALAVEATAFALPRFFLAGYGRQSLRMLARPMEIATIRRPSRSRETALVAGGLTADREGGNWRIRHETQN